MTVCVVLRRAVRCAAVYPIHSYLLGGDDQAGGSRWGWAGEGVG